MAATLRRLRTKADRLRAEQADALRQLVLDYPALPERPRGEIVAAIDRQTAAENGWTFVMLSPSQNKAVQRWLRRELASARRRRRSSGPSCSTTCAATPARSC